MAQPAAAERPVAVYRLYDTAGKLLYIGATVDPESRLKSHRRRFGDELDPELMTLDWYNTRAEADAAECAAIRAERPRRNHDGVIRAYRPHGGPSFRPAHRPAYVAPPPDSRYDPTGPDITSEYAAWVWRRPVAAYNRWLGRGNIPGAYQAADGQWFIPQAAMIAYEREVQRLTAIHCGWIEA